MLPFRRDYTATRINRVINDPSVKEMVATPEQLVEGAPLLDLGPVLSHLGNIALMTDEGGILAHKHEPGVYEIHTQFTETYRGVSCVKTVREMISWLFLHTDAQELLSKIPENNKPALGLVRAINGKFEFSREMVYPLPAGGLCGIDYYALRFADWIGNDWVVRELLPIGQEFHRALDTKREAFGAAPDSHPEDISHDIRVGATVEMIWAGQTDKGLTLYNRWARFAGYAEIRLVSYQPLVLDIGNTVLAVDTAGKDFEVISCR